MAKKPIKKDGKLKKSGLQKKVDGKITGIGKIEKKSDIVFTPHGITDDDGEMLDVQFTEE